MNFPLLEHAYPAEVAQLIVAVVALPLLLWTLFGGWTAEKRRRAAGANGPLVYLSRANLIRGTCRVLKAVVLIAVGILSVMMPPPSPNDVFPVGGDLLFITRQTLAEEHRANSLVRKGLIGVTLLLAIDAITEQVYRKKYMEAARETDCS